MRRAMGDQVASVCILVGQFIEDASKDFEKSSHASSD
jgi:hypothetical protein